jgi:epoxyqueuosine reductase
MNVRDDILNKASALGFDAAGICRPDQLGAAAEYFDRFIAEGGFGDMGWMAEKAHRRRDPKTLWPEVKSIIMVAMGYGPDHDPMQNIARRSSANISVYARGRDYHDVVKKRLKQLARHVHQSHGAQVKVFVDTAPVMEKPLAALAGIGWQGKHTNLVSSDLGSWFFLGALYTDLELAPDEPFEDLCGSCSACIDVCPTGAITAPYKLDARKCISYLTIEHKGHIDAAYRRQMGNRVYGCDDCLAVCPWNKFAGLAAEAALQAKTHLNEPALSTMLRLDDAGFRAFFSGSPIKRTGRDRFVRNCLIAAGNSGDTGLLPHINALSDDPSELVRTMAHWALGEIGDLDGNH